MLGWFGHPCIFLFFFLKKKKCDKGILGKKMSKWSNCYNLKVWGGVKCHILNFEGKSTNRWILQGGKR